MRVLLAEDDSALASFIKKGLEAETYAVDVASDGAQARDMVGEFAYDLLILDLNLPKIDGLSVLRTVRADKSGLPVLVLTARNRVEDRVECLDLGADDCLIKPFSYSELSARMRALLRRGTQTTESELAVEDLLLNRVERKVTRGGTRIELTQKEFAVLEFLMRNVGRTVTRAMIIENVWNLAFDSTTNVVDVYINYLRRKVDSDFERKLIHTVRGVGYRFGGE
jgi:DNA-binding response OmpR family regulator